MLKRTTPLTRKSRLSPMSPKRKKESEEYMALRAEFLRANPICEVWLAENGWEQTKWERCAFQGYIKTKCPNEGYFSTSGGLIDNYSAPISTEVHHRAKRGKNYLNTSTWMAVSRQNHERIERNKSWARSMGFLMDI